MARALAAGGVGLAAEKAAGKKDVKMKVTPIMLLKTKGAGGTNSQFLVTLLHA